MRVAARMSSRCDTKCHESYKGLVWGFCPKEEFCCGGTFEIAANTAVLRFNNRAKAVAKVLEEMGCSIRFYTEAACVGERAGTGEERSKEGQEERKEGLRRASSGPKRNNKIYEAGAFCRNVLLKYY